MPYDPEDEFLKALVVIFYVAMSGYVFSRIQTQPLFETIGELRGVCIMFLLTMVAFIVGECD